MQCFTTKNCILPPLVRHEHIYMFAEQLRAPFLRKARKQPHLHALPPSTFHISEEYIREAQPPEEKRNALAESTRQFNLYSSFYSLPELVKIHGKEKGIFFATLSAMLNILSIRQEMLGQIDTTDVVNLVEMDSAGELHFLNDHFGQAYDLEELLQKILEGADPVCRPRYYRENKQVIQVLRTLTQDIQKILKPSTREQFIANLESLGFHKETITLSPSFIIATPSLRARVTSIEDLDEIIKNTPTMSVWIGPQQSITVSPPHWLHRSNETGFAWASECIVFEDTKEVLIRQNGKFGASDEENLLRYLNYTQTERISFTSEDELMEYMNLLSSTDYKQPKVLLDFLVDQLGGIKSVGKIDRHIQDGYFDIKPYFEAIRAVFEIELTMFPTCSAQAIQQRLEEFSDLVKHQVARNSSRALPQIVAHYATLVQEAPYIQASSFKELLGLRALQLDAGFRIPIDFSLLDCVAGSPFSLVSKMGEGAGGMGGMTQAFGRNAEGQPVSKQEGINMRLRTDFASEKEARFFASHYGIPEDWFDKGHIHFNSDQIKCNNCGKARNYIGHCGEHVMCLQCNAQYNLDHGLAGDETSPQDRNKNQNTKSNSSQTSESVIYTKRGVSASITALFSGEQAYAPVAMY